MNGVLGCCPVLGGGGRVGGFGVVHQMAVCSLTLFMKPRNETMMNDLGCLFMQTRACTLMHKEGGKKKKEKDGRARKQ